MRNAPAANSIAGRKRLMRLSSGQHDADRGGGRQKRHRQPEANRTTSSSAAWPLCCCDAIARMPARIGPMHGDHPAAKAMPTSSDVQNVRAVAADDVGARVHHEQRNADHPHHLQAEDARRCTPPICAISAAVRVEHAADRAGGQAQSDEDEAESEHERDRVRERLQRAPRAVARP